MRSPRANHGATTRGFWRRGLTIVECVVAAVIVAVTGLTVLYVLGGGRARFAYAQRSLLRLRVGENLLDEVAGRSYFGAGSSRATWGVTKYDGFRDGPEALLDFTGAPYPDECEGITREVSVTPATLSMPALGVTPLTGMLVTVRVTDNDGSSLDLERFVAEPIR